MAQIASKALVRRLIEWGADPADPGQHVAPASAPKTRAEYNQAMSFALSLRRGQPGRATLATTCSGIESTGSAPEKT
jgi:hypothetical protein